MISDIYILATTLMKSFDGEGPFYNFVVESFPEIAMDHLPKYIDFKSIEYKRDFIINAFLEMLLSVDIESLHEMQEKGASVEQGYYHIQLESEEDLTRRFLPSVEFIIQKLHESYSFISSHLYYLSDQGIRLFVKMHTFQTNSEEEDFEFEDLQDYTELIDSYLYRGEIPESYTDLVAKMMLLQGQL